MPPLRPEPHASRLVSVACVLLSVVIWLSVLWGLFQIDSPLERFTRSLHLNWLDRVGDWLAVLGAGAFLAVLSGGLLVAGLVFKRRALHRAGLDGLIAHAGVALAVEVVKHLIGRPRPRMSHGAGLLLGPSWQSGLDSFPSGHAAASFAVAAVMAHHFPRGRWIWYGAASLVAVSRIVRGSHFVTDVAVGMWFGLLSGSVVVSPFHLWRVSVCAAWTAGMPYFIGAFGLLWIATHREGHEQLHQGIMLAAGIGILIVGTATRIVRRARLAKDPRPAWLPELHRAHALLGIGLALTTGSMLVTGLALLWTLTALLSRGGAASAGGTPTDCSVGIGFLENRQSQDPASRRINWTLVREAAFVVGLVGALLVIQGLKGILPLL